jgi:glycosyltransferase involved in cell wall biosynthesis
VVAADALGMPEIAEDGVNGYIFAPDDWKEMSEKILAILENENLLEKFSAASREASLLHSEDCLTKKLESIYKKLIMKSTKKTFLSKLSDKLIKL